MEKTKVKIPSEFKPLFDPQWRYFALYGGRASGKSQNVARALLLRGRQSKLRILCTREYQNSIADSVHKLLKDLIALYEFNDYEVLKDRITNTETGTEFIFRGLHNNVTEIKSTEGVDICWVEEAQSITEESIDVLTPTIRKEGSQIIFTYNRINELDPVHVKFVLNQPDKTFIAKINYDTLLKLGLLPDVIQQEIKYDEENDYDLYTHKWLGEPLAQTEMSIIGRKSILDAMKREIAGIGQDVYGVDVARMGSDRTIFWKRKGLKTIKFKEFTKKRIPTLADALEDFMAEDKEAELKIDDTGVGGGLTDEMLKRGYNTIPVNFGGKASDTDKYPNWISEAWFHVKTVMAEAQLPFNSDLLMELSSRQWKQDTKGRRGVESKMQYKARGFRSPDLADACIICYAPANVTKLIEIGEDDVSFI